MTLTIIFDKKQENVLMCFHSNQGMYNYIGGHIKHGENPVDASYREVKEETGIARDDINLHFVRRESVACSKACYDSAYWNLYVTAGILNKDVTLQQEKNPLHWVSLDDLDTILFDSFGYGNCYTYLQEALRVQDGQGRK